MRRALVPTVVLAMLCAATAQARAPAHRPARVHHARSHGHKHGPSRTPVHTPAKPPAPPASPDQRQAAKLDAQIASLKAQLVKLGAAEAGGEAAARDKKTRLATLNAQEKTLTDSIGARQTAIARLIGALMLYRRNPPPALLVHPSSAEDAVRAQILARAIAPELQAQSRALAAQIEEVRRLRRVVEAASGDLFKSESQLADQRAGLETMIDQKTALEQQLGLGGPQADAAAKALAAGASAPAQIIARLPAQPAQGEAAPAASDQPPQAPQAAPQAAAAGFIVPVQGELVSHYGQTTAKGRAEGMTWRASPGSPVLAPAAGVVEYAGPLKGYGVVLILATGGAYHLVLAGLQAASETTGQSVAAGEPIGRMANDAASASLYMEVRRDGEPVDPARWLGAARR